MVPADYGVAELSDDELRWIYDHQVARAGSGGRPHYDSIMAAAPFGLCAYCQYGQATTLDHFLPQAWIAGLAIEPWNLVPACQQCNKKLLSFHPDSPGQQMFFPRMESVTSRWLYAEVMDGAPAAVRFEARPHQGLDRLTRKRVLTQFETLGLPLLFAGVSGRDIAEAKSSLAGTTTVDGRGAGDPRTTQQFAPETVRALLTDTALRAFAFDSNNRRGAVYEALATSDWFCEGGCRD
nr:HNH endonuclease signature motif containing protein [Clavibacter michiganensis]